MSDYCITDAPARPDLVRFREGFGQRFVVTVDTEEEFDWAAPLDRDQHSIDTILQIRKFQQFCEGHGVVPIYLIDYPIATSPAISEVLADAVAAGRAEIGVHLHPWVNPPHIEDVNQHTSYAGNLPPGLELEKFRLLHQTIEKRFEKVPLIYRAGRYGAGPHTAAMLADAGIAIDTSVRSLFDYSAGGGPNYRDHPLSPYWIDRQRGLLELPVTTLFCGPLRGLGPALYPRFWRSPWLRGAFARAGLLERIPLTPEGVPVKDALRAIDQAVASELPVLVFSFHSPSLAPGYTPYVRNGDDLDGFYQWWRDVFDRLTRRGVKPTSVAEVMASVELA